MAVPSHLPSIIVNADDFGLHPAINAAIEDGHRSGLITSASVMTLAPAIADAVRRSRQMPALDIGLHFTLVGLPGMPPTFPAFFKAYFQGQFPAREIDQRLRQQLDSALVTHGLNITHIDSHQHLHAFPPIMRVVCAAAEDYGIKFIRLPADSPAFAPVSRTRRVEAAALRALCTLSRRMLFAHNRRTTDHFAGMAVSGHLTAATLTSYLQNAGPGSTEIVCHPGTDNKSLAPHFPWSYDWQSELAALRSPAARLADDNRRVRLIAWHEL